MDTLFTEMENAQRGRYAPLPVRMRPRTLDEVIGQEKALGPGTWLRSAIENDTLSSVVLYGPAGTGKTSIAHVIAGATHACFVEVSAIGGTVSDLRREIKEADKRLVSQGVRTILFVDEIHRFNRAQQDALLHAVENGTIVLVGATTENPYFEVNTALLSRSRVVQLSLLDDASIEKLIRQALVDERGLGGDFGITDEALSSIQLLASGDARSALNTLSLAADLARAQKAKVIDDDMVNKAVPERVLPYDKNKDVHYDVISAFIKSMRGSDPDAALYWLARMIDGGEDPKFIARRIFICASEDIGNADPQALLVAEAAFRAAEVIGYPECGLNLAQAAVYMCLAPKSFATSQGYFAALHEVKHGPKREVPDYLRDRHRPGSDEYGEYLYPHTDPRGYNEQRYLPQGLEKGCFFEPGQRGWESYRVDAAVRDHVERSQAQS